MSMNSLDEHSHLKSTIHQWDVRIKIVAFLVLIVAFATVQNLLLLPVMLLVTVGIFASSKLPWSFLKNRLELPGFFIIMLIIFLPFISGETVLAEAAGIKIRREGIESAALIGIRFVCILTLALTMFGTNPFLKSVKALRALKMPEILADMVLLTYRYLFEITNYFTTMTTAARMRGFSNKPSLGTVSTLAAMMGHMFVRSYEQSERVYKAMVLRGYGEEVIRPNEFQAKNADFMKLALFVVLAVAFLSAEWLL